MIRHLNWILAGLMFIFGFSSISYAKDDELATRVNVSTLSILSPNVGDFTFNTQAYLLCQGNMPDNELLKPEKPPLSQGRITAEIAVGTGAGLVTGFAGGFIAATNSSDDFIDSWDAFFLSFLAGEVIGTATGVYCIGSIGDQAGSFRATLWGSLCGMGVGFLLAYASNGDSASAVPFFVLPAVGATVMFNKTRRYETPPIRSAIMNLQDGKVSLAVPAISVCRNGKDFTSKVGLISFSF